MIADVAMLACLGCIAKETDTSQRELWDSSTTTLVSVQSLELALELGPVIASEADPHAFALGAKVLNESGKSLSYKKATNPNHPDSAKWVAAGEKELHKQIVELKSMQFVATIPKGRIAGYYRRVNVDGYVGDANLTRAQIAAAVAVLASIDLGRPCGVS